ncbi:hypothetical protein [Persicobacter diffluens]
MRKLASDPKLGKADKGWLKQDINQIKEAKGKIKEIHQEKI